LVRQGFKVVRKHLYCWNNLKVKTVKKENERRVL
jgi:hypothetical protein